MTSLGHDAYEKTCRSSLRMAASNGTVIGCPICMC